MATKITGTNTAAAPGVTGDDTDTGLFYGTNEIGFSTGGTSRATVDSSGNLNIPNDSGKIRLGTGNDLEVYHDGSNSFLKDITGDIIVRSADDVYIQPQNGELGVSVIGDGGVELYFDNSKRLETTNGGIRVHGPASGQCGVDVWATSGDSAYLKLITDNGVNPPDYYQVLHQNSDNSFRIQNYGDGSYEDNIVAKHGGAIELYFDASKKLETTSDGAQVTGALKVKVAGSAYGDGLILEDENSTSQSELTHVDGVLYITSNPPGATHVTLDSSGNLAIPRDNAKFKVGASDDLQIWHDSSTNKSIIKETGTGSFDIQGNWVQILNEAGDESKAIFKDDGAVELYHNGLKKFQTDSGGVVIQSSEGGEAWIQYNADEADDHNDIWRGGASTNGDWFLQNYAGSAWETNIKALGNGAVEIYYDNSKKLDTYSSGVTIYGHCALNDNGHVALGDGSDLRLYHDGSNSYLGNATGDIIIENTGGNTSNQIYIRGKTGVDSIRADGNGATYIYDQGSGSAILKISTNNNFGTILSNTTDDANFTNVLTLARRGYEASGYGVNFKVKGGSSSGQNGLLLQVSQGSGGYSDKFTFDNDGLKFGSDTAAANALNDYEEGTFDATMANSVTLHSSYNKCSYIKVGDLVHVSGEIRIDDAQSNAAVKINNLPFGCHANSEGNNYACGTVGLYSYSMNSGYTWTICKTSPGSSTLHFQVMKQSGNDSASLEANANGYIAFSITYKAA